MTNQENETTNPQDVTPPVTSADMTDVPDSSNPTAPGQPDEPSEQEPLLTTDTDPIDAAPAADFVVPHYETTEEAEGPVEDATAVSDEPVLESKPESTAEAEGPTDAPAEPEQPAASDTVTEPAAPATALPADADVPETDMEVAESAPDADLDATVPQSVTPAETTEEAEGPVADPIAEAAAFEPTDAETDDSHPTEEEAEDVPALPSIDYSQFTPQDFVNLLEEQSTILKGENVSPADFKRADLILKETKPVFDANKRADRALALQKFIEDTGSEEGFEYKPDDAVLAFDNLYKQIKSQKNQYFQNLDKAKDTNFSTKTDLLQRLRELVETDESNAVDPKVSWAGFKAIQDEWKAAGNMNSPHNATLWATYHALVDRYYSNRNIYFELKELDRKKNTTLKTEVIERVETLSAAYVEKPITRQTIDEANALFDEYKQIGPAPKAEQEILWMRMKAALDALYDKRREQNDEQRRESAGVYEEKSKIYEELLPHTSFSSGSINDWNDKTKEVMGLQDRWNAIKGPMPRDEGKELSKKFWAALKTFFANKSEFFRQLEGKREQNLALKVELCEQVEAILAAGDDTSEATNRVIELQRQWKSIGQVPEKQKNTIFDRFKAACDAFFDKKRSRSQETDREFEDNLTLKNALIERIEAAALTGANLTQLNDFKAEWANIGFVPKKDMQTIQKRYIAAINALVGSNAKLSPREKEKAIQDNETQGGGRPAGGGRRERDGGRDRGDRNSNRDSDGGDFGAYRRNSEGSGPGGDLRRRITALESDIATYNNNIEFFARSKNADKLRAEIEQKIATAQQQVNDLKQQLKEMQEAQA